MTRRRAALLFLFLVGALLRFACIGDKSINPDELCTIHAAQKGWHYVVDGWQRDSHPPLRYLPYYYWLMVSRKNDALLRLPAALFSLLTLPLIYLLGRRFLSSELALWASGIFAISPFSILYANCGTMYSLFPLLTVAILYAALAGMKHGGWHIPFALSAILGLYSHYYFFLILFAANLLFLLWPERRSVRWRTWIGLNALVCAAFLPWLPMFWHQMTSANDYILASPLKHVHKSLKVLYAFYCYSLGEAVRPTHWVVVVPSALLFSFLFIAGTLSLRPRRSGVDLALALFFFVPFSLASLKAVTVPKHLLFIYPLYLFILARGIARLGRLPWLKRLATLCVALASLYGLFNYYTNRQLHNEDFGLPWRQIARGISAQSSSDDLILLYPDISEPFNYYYNGPARLHVLAETLEPDQLVQTIRTLPNYKILYAVLYSGASSSTHQTRERLKELLRSKHPAAEAHFFSPRESALDALRGHPSKSHFLLEVFRYTVKEPAGTRTHKSTDAQ